MKKIGVFMVLICLLLAFCSCNDATVTTTTADGGGGDCQHVLADATCTVPAKCTLCNRPFGTMLGHVWADGSCQRCGRADSLAQKAEGIVRVVCIGDSITKGGYWNDRFGKNLDDTYEVIENNIMKLYCKYYKMKEQ